MLTLHILDTDIPLLEGSIEPDDIVVIQQSVHRYSASFNDKIKEVVKSADRLNAGIHSRLIFGFDKWILTVEKDGCLQEEIARFIFNAKEDVAEFNWGNLQRYRKRVESDIPVNNLVMIARQWIENAKREVEAAKKNLKDSEQCLEALVQENFRSMIDNDPNIPEDIKAIVKSCAPPKFCPPT
jgi:hypothetical protein